MTTKKLSTDQQGAALGIIAAWLGPKMGCEGPAPTGRDAANMGIGPMLNPEWDWPSSGPTPTILLEGGPHDWAIDASMDEDVIHDMKLIGVFAEPYAGYALCLYQIDHDA